MQGKERFIAMSVKDVIKSSVYNSLGGGTNLTIKGILFILAAACLIGLYVYAVYKLTSKSVFYSKDLNVTIAGLPVIIAAIMVAMQSNLLVSLGMVGALSIVRFRSAIKNPLDLLYLFWSISAGIICGVGLTMLAIALCIIMTVMLLILEMLPNSKAPLLLIIRTGCENTNWEEIVKTIRQYSKYMKEKSRNIRNEETEAIFEINTRMQNALLQDLKQNTQIKQINLLSHDGEYRI